MEFKDSSEKKRRELERRVLEKVGHVINAVKDAKHVDQVTVSLYSLAACLFTVQSNSISGSVDEKFRDELLAVEVPSEDERTEWWNVFYKGSAFRAFARVLLYDVASNWLACFPTSARKYVYDVFFASGLASEVVRVVVPCLQQTGSGSHDSDSVCSNAERLIVLCLLENDGVLQMVREFSGSCHYENLSQEQLKQAISSVLQLVTSIPDKARRGAPRSLSPHLFFKKITTQLLLGVEDWDFKLGDNSPVASGIDQNGAILFVGEAFVRICRRGSTDVLLSEIIPRILGHVQSVLCSSSDLSMCEIFETKAGSRFWLSIMGSINDSHSIERIAEQLLHQLAAQNVNDVEGYWILWILFRHLYKSQSSIRSTFIEKFLLWKVFPTCCLRWILQFSVLQIAPDNSSNSYNTRVLSDTVQRLVLAWSKTEFVQSTTTEQQAYVTTALGLCLEKMSKEDLNATKDALPSILRGISCRLESPVYLVRKMASNIALVFSKIIDPQNPLYLDDTSREETVDWDFGLNTPIKGSLETTTLNGDIRKIEDNGTGDTPKSRNKKEIKLSSLDPDEVIDPGMLNTESNEDESENESEDSEASNESLQPYDLTDDDTDLQRKFSQLVDVVGALRKSDDAEGVEKALDVTEKLIRASPHELKHMASDLAKTLVQVRCPEFSLEGEEESAEEKRQKALIALIVTSPLESLISLHKLLFSSNLDTSQRIIILDAMTDAATELTNVKIIKPENRRKSLIQSTSDQPWFVPKNVGPPGAGSWKEVSTTGTLLNWSYSYERDLPSKSGGIKKGKTRRWSIRPPAQDNNQIEGSRNGFPQFAAAFMLPAMEGFDKKRQGVDLLGRDFIVLGKLIYMLGVCIKCAAMHPEASVLASPLLDMLRSREISHHAESYVRRSVLFAASCILVSLHPTFVASAVVGGNIEISEGLDWVRNWALQVAESDTDRECHTLAIGCLQLHAEMSLQASRALESTKDTSTAAKSISLFPNMEKPSIKISYLNS